MSGLPIARVLGVEIRVQGAWILVLGLVAAIAASQVGNVDPTLPELTRWVLGGLVAMGFLASTIAHDLGHALVARRNGVSVPAILVSFFGGTTPFDPTAADPSGELRIAIAGPAASVGIGAILGVVAIGVDSLAGPGFDALAAVLGLLAALNLLLGLVNVLPAYPMDGGRVVRALAWSRTGLERSGWRGAARTGRVVGLVIAGSGIALMLMGEMANGAMVALSGWLFILSGRAIRERLRVDELIGDVRVADAMEADPATVRPTLTVDTIAAQLLDGESEITAVAVVDEDDRLVGLLGLRQVRRIRPERRTTTHVGEVMASGPGLPVVTSDEPLIGALERLQRSGLDGLPVVDDDRLVGVMTRHSVGRLIIERKAIVEGATPAGRRPGRR